MTDLGDYFARYRRLGDEMMSRGPWDQEAVERRVRGFYKFNPPFVQLDEYEYNIMRSADPGLPDWVEFLRLLDDSPLRQAVVG